ncbi:inverse autotransporter beta domain-containing protein, partial [Escherichia coli]|uniref:inverse autotransporter beta domain-containing protein n=2 Tax=Escherichia coli TaxID=562 RepID=UPI003D9AB347
MSGWRDAPELDKDYEARPANGWDLRADAWLPAWPQLGGKLAYEQYYGDEVALFGTDNRQKDPHAFTVGLNYTPFPLLTFSAEQRQGKGGENDTRLGVGLTWQPDVAWQKQTDPDAVGSRRSLAGSRHDLVERNNSIVLEYRKKTLVKLRLNDPVKGKPVVASLQTKYALKGYTVEAPGITVAGGKVETPPGQVVVTLPAYRYTQTPETDNVYRVSVVAEDVKGNRSERADASVVVTEPELTAATSEVKADRSSVTANGVDRVTLTYHARDVNGYEVQGLKLTTRTEGVKDVTLSEWKDNGDGSYTQEVTAGRTTGTVSLMPQVKGSDAAKDAVQLTLTAGDMVADKSTVSVQPASIKADGAEATTVTYQARDAHGNLVPLQATDVTLSVSGVEATTFSGFTESVPGVYVGTLTGTRTGTASLMPQVNGSDAAKDAAQLTLTAGAPYANSSTVTLAATSLTVGDTHTTTATWTVKDEHNNPVTGLTDATLNVTSQTEGVTVTATAWAEDINSPGTYTATVTAGDKAGTVRLMPQVNGSDAAKDAA